MRTFFDGLGQIEYVSASGKTSVVRNIFEISGNFRAVEKYKRDERYYFSHEISDGEKWEDIAVKYYGDRGIECSWVLFAMNDVVDVFYDFALSSSELEQSTSFGMPSGSVSSDEFDKASQINDDKRIIRVLKPEHMSSFERDFFGQ